MIIPPGITTLGTQSTDIWDEVLIRPISANGRPFGMAFTLSDSRPSFVTYSIDVNIPAATGGTATITASVNGTFVSGSRNTEIENLGASGNIQRREVISFFVPADGSVVIGRSLTSGVTAAIAGGQEVIF